jgi:nitroreductase
MDVLEAIRRRRSIRRFRRDEIPGTAFALFEEALLSAPSAGNLQSRRFYFVFRQDLKDKLAAAAYGQDFIRDAPVAVVCCSDLRIGRRYGERGVSVYALQDVAASVQNLLVVAASLSLGTVWVGAFDEDKAAKILDLPPYLRPVAIVPVGFPDEKPSVPDKIGKDKAITYLR